MKEKVLITGIAGLLGSHFSRYLVSKGYNVIGIDDFSNGYEENLAKDIKCAQFNLVDLQAVDSFFKKEKPDYVYHFAAYAAEGLSPFIRNYNYTNNIICSTNLITSSINYDVKKFIFASSMAVYGDHYAPPFTEDMIPKPIDTYGIAKYAVEMDLQQAFMQFGLKYSIVRPHNVIGIYQNIWDKYRNVIGIWIKQSISGENITIYGDGLQKRAFSDMKFYNEPLEKLMHSCDSEIFNLGSNHSITILEAAQMLQKTAQKYGFNPQIVHLESRHEAKYAYSNHEKAKKLLDFKDETNLEKVMDEMFKWALTQPVREVKKIEYEINKNMYSFWKGH